MPHFVSHADNYRKVVKEECKVLLRSVIGARARTKYRIVSNPRRAGARGGGGRVLNEIASYFGKWIT